jgi:hypothetical protein
MFSVEKSLSVCAPPKGPGIVLSDVVGREGIEASTYC